MPQRVSSRRRLLLLLALAAAAAPPLLAAADAFTLFDKFIAQPVATLTFQQRTYDGRNTLLSESGGMLLYQRPDKFRLQYDAPDNPLIISDGITMWVYEADLQQVVTQPFASASKNGLLEVLTAGHTAALEKGYVLSANVGSRLHWLNADAADTDAAIRLIALGFNAASGDLKQVVITDHFDGRVEMDIQQIENSVADPAAVFSFIPPAGTEVVPAN